jgi:hypothetical protein
LPAELGCHFAGFGVDDAVRRVDFAPIGDGVRRVIAGLAPPDSAESFQEFGDTLQILPRARASSQSYSPALLSPRTRQLVRLPPRFR